jgi:hypothetical protein
MANEPLLDESDIAALGGMVRPPEGGPAVAEPKEPEPAAVPVTPVVPEEEPGDDAVSLDDLARLQADTLAELGKLTQKLVADERAKGDHREEDAILSELAEESEPLQKLGAKVVSLEKGINQLLERAQRQDEMAAQAKLATDLAADYEAQAGQLLARFPALNEKDMDKVWDWMEKNPAEASRMSVGMSAEKVLGYDYLDARRNPIAGPNGKLPSPPPVVSSAKVVTDAAMGGGAPPGSTKPSTTHGDVRDAMNDIRSDPAALARLGSFGR